jgi:uncharacterized membrane protein
MNLSLEHPEMLLLIIPLIIVGFYLLRKTKTKIVEWRMLVAFLLIIALAAPFTTVTQTVNESNPSLVLIQDKTASMGIFPNETGNDLYKALAANTPTSLVQLTGDKTNLGDAVTQYSGNGNQIVLITDGNNNSGKSLVDALGFAKETNTSVYLVEPELQKNDLSVELLGDKDVVVDNQNEFNVVVRQASEQNVSYSLEVYVDGQLSQSGPYSQGTRNNTIPIYETFSTLGAHNISVKISPSGEDLNSINNVYQKSLYVIPKPKLTLVTNEPNSPLAQTLNSLYNTSVFTTYPGATALNSSKALVLDNQFVSNLSEDQVKEINKYVNNGGGLVVVGGERAYNYGNYLNSSFEKILPVLSKPSDYKGGRDVVLILDISPSTQTGDKKTLDDILGNAISILENKNIRDANAGVIAFGSQGYDVSGGLVFLGLSQNRAMLETRIKELVPDEQTKTSLNDGLTFAKTMLSGETGERDAIIISDGGIEESYDKSLEVAKELKDMKVNLYFVHVLSPATSSQIDKKTRKYYAETLMQSLGLENNYMRINMGERANIGLESTDKSQEEDNQKENENTTSDYSLYAYSQDSFITKGIEFNNTNITGYNDVTPKAGAERLVITASNGKPVITTWRFGLGRVAAFTTDNGAGEGSRWATNVYNGSNLTSRMVNWAIGNPRAKEGVVLDSPDTWLGTPSNLTLTMYDEGIPQLNLDGSPLDLSLTGRNTYETTVNPSSIGIHDISGYPVAVNYQLEYRDVGINKDIEPLILATGGKIYNEKEARAFLLKDAKQNSVKQSNEEVSLKVYVLLAALLLYLGEIIARRIREMRKFQNLQVEAKV